MVGRNVRNFVNLSSVKGKFWAIYHGEMKKGEHGSQQVEVYQNR